MVVQVKKYVVEGTENIKEKVKKNKNLFEGIIGDLSAEASIEFYNTWAFFGYKRILFIGEPKEIERAKKTVEDKLNVKLLE